MIGKESKWTNLGVSPKPKHKQNPNLSRRYNILQRIEGEIERIHAHSYVSPKLGT